MKFAGTVLWDDIISRNPSMRGKAGAGKRNKMVAALAKARDGIGPCDSGTALIGAFVWKETVQGRDFWERVYWGEF